MVAANECKYFALANCMNICKNKERCVVNSRSAHYRITCGMGLHILLTAKVPCLSLANHTHIQCNHHDITCVGAKCLSSQVFISNESTFIFCSTTRQYMWWFYEPTASYLSPSNNDEHFDQVILSRHSTKQKSHKNIQCIVLFK